MLSGDRYAFLNFTEEMLRSEVIPLLPAKDVIIEILEDVKVDAALLENIFLLKQKGYVFALDDYTGETNILTEVADIIKVDFRLTTRNMQKQIAQTYPNKILLAEKIETEEEFLQAKKLNFRLFQGYYFSKPIMLSHETLEIALSSYLRLWTELNQPELDIDQIEQIIRMDVSLSYKLLLRINSMEYYRGKHLTSVRQAIMQIGSENLKRWLLLLLIRDCHGDTGNLSAKAALVRAIFAEQITVMLGYFNLQEAAYVAGLFSTIDADINLTLQEIVHKLNLSIDVKDALIGTPGPLADILQFTMQFEKGDWDSVSQFISQNGLNRDDLTYFHLEAIEFAEKAFSI